MIDAVFAIVIVVIVIDLPAPEESIAFDLASFIAFQVNSLLIAMLGIIVVLVYWFQSNLLLGNLDRTNGAHAALQLRVLAEPLTALLTLALAYVSAMAWELGWFAYPLIAAMLRKTGVGSTAHPVAAPAPAASDDESQEASK